MSLTLGCDPVTGKFEGILVDAGQGVRGYITSGDVVEYIKKLEADLIAARTVAAVLEDDDAERFTTDWDSDRCEFCSADVQRDPVKHKPDCWRYRRQQALAAFRARQP